MRRTCVQIPRYSPYGDTYRGDEWDGNSIATITSIHRPSGRIIGLGKGVFVGKSSTLLMFLRMISLALDLLG